jgi:hypothetical protein
MASRQFFHDIIVACDAEDVFDYVTDPGSWHEWSSASVPPSTVPPSQPSAQKAGSQFQVQTVQRPIPFLPLTFSHTLTCTVCKLDRPYLWEVAAESPLVETITSYTLSRCEEGTTLKRQFRYTPKSWTRIAEPLLRRRIQRHTAASLSNLKSALEKRC